MHCASALHAFFISAVQVQNQIQTCHHPLVLSLPVAHSVTPLYPSLMASNGESKGIPSFKIGFKFNTTNKAKSAVQPIKSTVEDFSENVDFITSIDNNKIKGSKREVSAKSKELIIPLIAVNKYNIDNAHQASATANSDDLSGQAKLELLEDAKKFNDNQNEESALPAWQSMVINKVPDEYENDSKLDVSLRPDVSTLDDYENVPIESFGTALLRGMGWKNGEPIGGINKAITPIFEPQIRARGLGLGADASLQKQLQEANKSGL